MWKKTLALFGALLLLISLAVPSLAVIPEITAPQYTGITLRALVVRATPSKDGESLGQVREKTRVSIYDFTPQFLRIDYNGAQGYILRTQVNEILPLNPQGTLPYGAIVHHQSARVIETTNVYKAKNTENGAWCALTEGSLISFWYIQDGWAVVPYQREIGYVPVGTLKDLTPVSPTVDYARSGDMLASFTSFYNVAQTEMNKGRMVNIGVACKYISITMSPGEKFSFNNVAGPYREARGYQPAPVLINGTTAPGYGGGTCQVSTTLYNVLLQLPEGMTIVHRRPHGPAGAKYVPHGVDAAVGSPQLDLIFQNDFPFPIRIQASAQDGALFIAILKA